MKVSQELDPKGGSPVGQAPPALSLDSLSFGSRSLVWIHMEWPEFLEFHSHMSVYWMYTIV